MQKIINVLAVASSVVSLAVVGGGFYLYMEKDTIIDGVKSQVMESVTGSLGSLGGLGGGAALPIGSNDLPSTPQAAAPGGGSMGLPVPSSPF